MKRAKRKPPTRIVREPEAETADSTTPPPSPYDSPFWPAVQQELDVWPMQLKVLQLAIVEDLTQAGIARRLRRSTSTVHSHFAALRHKFGVRTRAAIAARLLTTKAAHDHDMLAHIHPILREIIVQHLPAPAPREPPAPSRGCADQPASPSPRSSPGRAGG